MSSVFLGENLSYSDTEEGAQYVDYLDTEYFPKEEESVSAASILHKWQRTPRSPADFSDSKSRVSSCRDSDYEAWLENYYHELTKEETKLTFADKEVDTSDLTPGKPKEVYTSLFQEVKKNNWTGSTKYWGPQDTRRHWPLYKRKGEYLFFPTIHPHLNLTSRYGRYYSLMNSAAAVPEIGFKQSVCQNVKKLIQGLNRNHPQLKKIFICDTFCNLKWFDYMGKTSVLRSLCEFLRSQNQIEKAYFESANLTKLEGLVLLCALTKNGGARRIKELHIWRMFSPDENPLLLNQQTATGVHAKKIRSIARFTKTHYLQILNNFTSLTHLSVNYAYLANKNGDALLCLKSLRYGHLKELRLLCLNSERPFLTDPALGSGGCSIADGVWRRASELSPDLRVMMVFDNMPRYEDVITFLSESIPLSYIYISAGVDFSFRKPWDVDSTLLELRNWYAPTLENLSLHFWHHRDLLDFVLKYKILDEFPNLVTFEFIGIVKDVEVIEAFCNQLSKGNYKLKSLLFWVQEEHTNRERKSLTQKRVKEIRESYKKIFQVLDIDANLKTYSL